MSDHDYYLLRDEPGQYGGEVREIVEDEAPVICQVCGETLDVEEDQIHWEGSKAKHRFCLMAFEINDGVVTVLA